MTLSSMTGFARFEGEAAGVAWVWELKSVNGKSLDLRLRLPPGYDLLETSLRSAMASRLRRGNVTANLTISRTAPPAIQINREMLARVLGLIGELSAEIEAAPPRLDGLIALRGVIETVDDEPDDVVEARRTALSEGWREAVERLAAARAEEGARLATMLSQQVEELATLTASAAASAAAQPEALRSRLEQSLKVLGEVAATMPQERVAQELALLVSRGDVREELDRLRAHIAQAGELLRKGGAVGRQLDFLCQELNREANTLCSKSADIELTR
ncbi:MAG: YicC family protein, partial [Alphaproteobacteria bacterium]|nr:YicC family protein [Alphaproteobacteria bacterium]